MKALFVAVPFLLQIAAFAALYAHRNAVVASSPPPTEHVDICELHRQRDRIAAQLAAFEHKPKQFLPRGVGPTPSDDTHTALGNH